MNSPLRILRVLFATLIALAFAGAAAFGAEPATEIESASAATSAPVALAGVGAALGAAGLLGAWRRDGARRARDEALETAVGRRAAHDAIDEHLSAHCGKCDAQRF